MSADNWAVCPRCDRLRTESIAARREAVAKAYGTVPVEEFDTMRAKLEEDSSKRPEPTLREDYEFYGAEEGTVHADYSCHCSTCGLSLKFSIERELDVNG